MPRFDAATPPPIADDSETWDMGPLPEHVAPPPRRGPGPLTVIGLGGLMIALILGGVAVYVGINPLDWVQPAPPPPPEQSGPPVVAWTPDGHPLAEGIVVPGPAPSTLRWSPDGSALAWRAFQAGKGGPRFRRLPVTETFGKPKRIEEPPPWLERPAPPAPVQIAVESGILVLRDLEGDTIGLIDMAQVVDARRPRGLAIATWNQRVRVAVVGDPLPDEVTGETPPTRLYVFDITNLVYRPVLDAPDAGAAGAP